MNTIIGAIVVGAILVFIISQAKPGSRVSQVGHWFAGLAAAAGTAIWYYITNGGG